jgi:hypothetical protein
MTFLQSQTDNQSLNRARNALKRSTSHQPGIHLALKSSTSHQPGIHLALKPSTSHQPGIQFYSCLEFIFQESLSARKLQLD